VTREHINARIGNLVFKEIEIVGRLIRSRQLAHPSGFPSISLISRWLDSGKPQRIISMWHLAQTPCGNCFEMPSHCVSLTSLQKPNETK
jgi:hypothetical protein